MRKEPEYTVVGIDDVEFDGRLRPLNEESVESLMHSIERIGLQSDISIRWAARSDGGEDYDVPVLVAGRHRLEALKRLGRLTVDCLVFRDETEARLWEISENLHRAELTALERSEHVAEWVKLTEEKNIGASCADIPRGRGQPQGGINAATRELGIERTEAQRSVKIASLSDEAKETARSIGLDNNQSALLAAARAPNPEAELRRIKADREASEAAKRNRETDNAIKLTLADEYGEWILRNVDLAEINTVISWIEGAKPKDVIAKIRRDIA